MSTNGPIQILETQRAALAERIEERLAEIKAERARLKEFDDALALLRGTPVEAKERPTRHTSAPRTQDVVLAILPLQEEGDGMPKMGMGTAAILGRLATIGRSTTPNSLLSMLSRVKADEFAVKDPIKGWFSTPKGVVQARSAGVYDQYPDLGARIQSPGAEAPGDQVQNGEGAGIPKSSGNVTAPNDVDAPGANPAQPAE